MALNFPIQGSSAEITKLACIYIFEYILKNDLQEVVKFSNVIHDEILLECPESIGTILQDVVSSCMERAGKIYCKVIPLKAECKLSKYWNH
jgi:DNA polymerase-1